MNFPNPNAKVIEDLEQGTMEWLKLRQQHITATDVAAILGKSPWATPLTLFKSKKQETPEPATSPWLRAGSMYEEAILLRAVKEYGMADFHHGQVLEDGWKLASLDGDALLNGERVIVEAKTTTNPSHWFDGSGMEITPEYYVLQVQWQMLVSGIGTTIFTVGNLDGKTFSDYGEWFTRVVHADLEMQAILEDICKQFYDRLVDDVPPSVSIAPYNEYIGKDESNILKERVGQDEDSVEIDESLFKHYAVLKDSEKTLKAQVVGQYNALLESLGTHSCGTINGKPVVKWVKGFGGRNYLKILK